MRAATYSSQFARDLKRMQKRGKPMQKLKSLVELLLEGEPLPPVYRDTQLKHNRPAAAMRTLSRTGS